MDCFLVAMGSEAAYLLGKSHVKETKEAGFAKISLCSLKGKDFLLVQTGIGKAFAASGATSACLLYPGLTSLINIGVAGSLDAKEVPLFSSVIATSLVEHDLDTSAIGDPKGLVSGIDLVKLPADPALRKKLVSAAETLGIDPLAGLISSGDTFYADQANKRRIHEEFGSLCSDMEAAPMAQVAYVFHKPFACLRVISDADNAAEEYPENAKKAADIAGRIAENYLAL